MHILDKDTTNHRVREAKPEMHFPFICKSGQKRTRALFRLILPLGFDEITLLDGNGRTSFRHVERIHDGKTVHRCLLVSPVMGMGCDPLRPSRKIVNCCVSVQMVRLTGCDHVLMKLPCLNEVMKHWQCASLAYYVHVFFPRIVWQSTSSPSPYPFPHPVRLLE